MSGSTGFSPTAVTPVPRGRKRRVGILLFDDVKTLDFVGPAEVFVEANQRVDGYELVLLSVDGEDVTTSMGVRIAVNARAIDSGEFDTIIVPGSEKAPLVYQNDQLIRAVADLASRSSRVVSICSGAYALAAAGLLDGKAATTHWKFAAELQRRFPSIHVDADSIFIRDADTYTSAGVAAGIDLALSLVEEDHGPDVARSVAQLLLVYMQRSGGQSQFSASLKALPPRTPLVKAIFDYVNADPRRPATIGTLAAHVNVSVRHLNRVVRDETGLTPSDYVTSMRVDLATRLLDSGAAATHVAAEVGFSSPAALRRAFARHLGVTPRDYQRQFRTTRRNPPTHAPTRDPSE